MAIAGCVAAALAQQEVPSGGGAAGRPTEYGLRFTPGMARSLAGQYVRQALAPRYQLDPAKVDETIEAVARRIMAMAHRLDDDRTAESLERMIEGIMEGQFEAGGGSGIQPKSGRAIGEALRPVMPALRDLVRGIAQDVRPKLAPKEQLKFGVELLAFTTAIDAFEQTMDRWARGEARPGENPFQGDDQLKRDESGRTAAYKSAEEQARQAVEKGEWEEWKKYVADAKKFYEFDEGQAATADSILNECLQRAAQYTQSEDWRRKVQRNQVWKNMLFQLQVGPVHPLRYYLQRQYSQMLDPISAIGAELKQQIDAIPTQAQRRSAEDRILQALGAQGFVEAEVGGQSTQEVAAAEGEARQPTSTESPSPEPVFDEKGSANEEPIRAGEKP